MADKSPALTPDPENARVHDDANRAAIRSSLDQFGAGRSILADADGIIRAGNGTFEAASEAGLPMRVVETDGSELVVVKRTDLRGDRARAMGIADNRAAEMARWDAERLRGMCSELRESFDLDAIGLDEAALSRIAGELSEEPQPEYSIDPADGAKLTELFVVPPFSVFDARQGYWQERKRAWLALGIRSELGRGTGVHQYSEAATISRQGGTLGHNGGDSGSRPNVPRGS